MELDQSYLVKMDSDEWHAMWQAFVQAVRAADLGDGSDRAQHNAYWGESWQYMGSEHDGPMDVHTFRHRAHPKDGQRKYVTARTSAKVR